MMAGAPNRPLPPTPDEDANERTLIMKRVSGTFRPSAKVGRVFARVAGSSIELNGGMPFTSLFEFFSASLARASLFRRFSVFFEPCRSCTCVFLRIFFRSVWMRVA